MNPLYYAIAATVCLCALIYSALHYQRKAAERKKQDECARKVNDIKAAFKATLELFTMQRLMRPGHVKQVYGVVNNYFLYQPITEEKHQKAGVFGQSHHHHHCQRNQYVQKPGRHRMGQTQIGQLRHPPAKRCQEVQQKLLHHRHQTSGARPDHQQIHLYPTPRRLKG